MLQAAVELAQREARGFEGVVYHLNEDDKGTGLIIVFGIPGNSHADDHVRALVLAKKLNAAFDDIGMASRMGIATGKVFCGPLGTDARRQYSIIGSSINLSARLMTLAPEGEIYCDSQTRKLAEGALEFEEAGWITPKGFREPVAIFKPGEQIILKTTDAAQSVMIGREAELKLIASQIDEITASGASRLLVIQAEAGVGKSTLLHKVHEIIAAKGRTTITGAADAFETETAYFAIRPIARIWCGVNPDCAPDTAIEILSRKLESEPELAALIPLLGPVLGLDLRENDTTRRLRGQLRSDNTLRVLRHIAQSNLAVSPAVLVIEDGHWMDGASWGFIEHLLDNVPSALVLLSTRPLPDTHGEAARVLARENTQIIDLKPMARSDTEEMIRAQLGVSEVSARALDLVYGRAEGNPLYVREIVRNLAETGDVQIRQSRVELVNPQNDEVTVPNTLDGIITSRIDRLEPDLQITIKAAAVLGRSFNAALLHAVHPLSIDRSELDKQLKLLERNGFLTQSDAVGRYAFDHALTRDAAYNLLSFAQRESLHHDTALALERTMAGHTEQVNARLGYHFRMAGIPDKAAFHLSAAGVTALDAYASRDAIELLTTALELDEGFRGADLGVDLNRTYWCRLIGQANYNQDKQPEAAKWYRRSIEEAGVAPRFPVMSSIGTVARAVINPGSLDRPPPTGLSEEDRLRITHALGSTRELGIIYLWESAIGKFTLNAVNQVRVARMVGPTEETANAIAGLAFLMSSGGLRKRSEQVALQSVRMATDFGDLAQLVAVQVTAGMVLIQNGAPSRARPLFEAAEAASNELISGVWRHRSKYMLADMHTWLGDYERAHQLFVETAKLSHAAEPHAVALATSMSALNVLRMGRPEKAIELLQGPEGVPHALDCGVPFASIMSLGILAEARLAAGQKDAALSAATEAEAQATKEDDGTGFYSGLFGYTSILNVRLQTGELGQPRERGSKSAAHEDLKKIRKLTRVAPLGRATQFRCEGLIQAHDGNDAKARRLLQKAVDVATGMDQPFELGRSLVELAKLSEGEARQGYLNQAFDVFEKHNMPLELALAHSQLK